MRRSKNSAGNGNPQVRVQQLIAQRSARVPRCARVRMRRRKQHVPMYAQWVGCKGSPKFHITAQCGGRRGLHSLFHLYTQAASTATGSVYTNRAVPCVYRYSVQAQVRQQCVGNEAAACGKIWPNARRGGVKVGNCSKARRRGVGCMCMAGTEMACQQSHSVRNHSRW